MDGSETLSEFTSPMKDQKKRGKREKEERKESEIRKIKNTA